MTIPNKIIPYEESVIFYFPRILCIMEKQRVISPLELYKKVKKDIPNVAFYMEILDCLFALGKINLDEERELLTYVV